MALPLLGTSKLGLEVIQEIAGVVGAVRFDCHSFGVAINLAVQRFSVTGLEAFAANPGFSVDPNFVTNKGYNYSTGVNFIFGWLWQAQQVEPTPLLQVLLSMQQQEILIWWQALLELTLLLIHLTVEHVTIRQLQVLQLLLCQQRL